MLKSLPKIITTIFLIIFIFQLISLVFLFVLPVASQAADPAATFKPQVPIPGMDQADAFGSPDSSGGYAIPGSTASIAKYVRVIYKYAIGIVGILAAVVLMVGGVMWIVAGGNATAIGEAKSWIGASLTGLLLALLSYLILATVNPALVDLKTTGIAQVNKNSSNETCQWTEVPNNKFCKDAPGLNNQWVISDSTKCGEKKATATPSTECCCQTNELAPTTVDVTKKHMGCSLESLTGTPQFVCREVLGDGPNECSSPQDCIDNQSVCCLQNWSVLGEGLFGLPGYTKCEILTNKACLTIGANANPNKTCQNGTFGWGCAVK